MVDAAAPWRPGRQSYCGSVTSLHCQDDGTMVSAIVVSDGRRDGSRCIHSVVPEMRRLW